MPGDDEMSNNHNNSTAYNEALRLDLSILEALLQRGRCQHSKAKYYQRTSMALRALQREGLLELHSTAWSLHRRMVERQSENRNRRDDDEQWDLKSLVPNETTTTPLLDTAALQSLHKIHQTLQHGLPQVLSRLEYASEPLFLEIQRGFLVPFCTVALGAIARIRVLLMRLAHSVLDVLQEVQRQVGASHPHVLTPEEVMQLRHQFTEPEEGGAIRSRKDRMRQILERLGFPDSKQSYDIGLAEEEEEATAQDDNDSANSVKKSDKAPSDVDLGLMEPTERIKPKHPTTESNDLGQPVLFSDEADTGASDGAISSRPSSRSVSPATPAMMKLLEETKKGKKNKKKDKKKRKSSSKEQDDGKKKKQKKKKKKEDFFDDLFG